MSIITHYMSENHRQCDNLFAEAEEAVSAGWWGDADRLFVRVLTEIERHFQAEEQILFPIIEERVPTATGPTHVMRDEHEHIRQGLDEMAEAVAEKDGEGYLALTGELLIMIQQHNLKEEQILYPMADSMLGPAAKEVFDQISSMSR